MNKETICKLIKTFDPYGMSDLEPAELPDTKEDLIDALFEHYVGGELIPPNDLEFLELIMHIEEA